MRSSSSRHSKLAQYARGRVDQDRTTYEVDPHMEARALEGLIQPVDHHAVRPAAIVGM